MTTVKINFALFKHMHKDDLVSGGQEKDWVIEIIAGAINQIYANVSTLVKSYLIGPNVLLNKTHPQNTQHDELFNHRNNKILNK